ncbi:prolyl 4-hydroxylase subunit alpha-1 [Drosophila subpulchrella]|uniref:prolyl 4-hydroxylase subunit alpha-1 n=1 Tax=Drosophila subpulchrella TaxID=1486046 RepID=UPI0018A1A05A|nr:prolyl 4-hydroxylase subunit alpha-1 [Drosophila subpulchrella]
MKWFVFQISLLYIFFPHNFCSNDTENPEEKMIYSTSVMSMVKLLEMEESLKASLEVYVQEMQSKLDIIKLFQESLKRKTLTTLEEREEYMANPLNAFPLLRRLNQDWPKWLRYIKLAIATKKIKEIEVHLKSAPNDDDLEVALKGMARIEKMYNQHADDLTKGLLMGRKFNSYLTAPDCVALGDFYYNTTKYSRSTHWYRMALRLHNLPQGMLYEKVLGLKRKKIYKKYGKALLKESVASDKAKATPVELTEWNSLAKEVTKEDNYDNVKQLIDEYLSVDEKIFQDEAAKLRRKSSRLERGCRGEWPKKSSPELICRYNRDTSAFLNLAPLKMEFLNMQPLVVMYHDVLYESEFKSLRDIAILNATMSDGLTYVDFDKNGKPKPQDRVVKMITFQGTTPSATLSINRRIADMSGLEMQENMALFLTNYGLGSHFGKHVDYVELAERPPNFFSHLGGDRIATALLYATDVQLGGTTVFTKLKISVEPKKGNALIWFNLNNAGDPDPQTEHSVCPVVMGSRWTISKWIHERQQVFKKPCFA